MFQKSVNKIQVSLKYDKKNEDYIWRPRHVFDSILLNSSYNEKCIKQKF